MYIKYNTFCIINRLAIIEYYRHCGYESSVMQFIFRVNFSQHRNSTRIPILTRAKDIRCCLLLITDFRLEHFPFPEHLDVQSRDTIYL